jgi:hypothetical protein
MNVTAFVRCNKCVAVEGLTGIAPCGGLAARNEQASQTFNIAKGTFPVAFCQASQFSVTLMPAPTSTLPPVVAPDRLARTGPLV